MANDVWVVGAEKGEEEMGALCGEVPGERPFERETRDEDEALGGEPIGPKSGTLGELRSDWGLRRGVLRGRGGGDFEASWGCS